MNRRVPMRRRGFVPFVMVLLASCAGGCRHETLPGREYAVALVPPAVGPVAVMTEVVEQTVSGDCASYGPEQLVSLDVVVGDAARELIVRKPWTWRGNILFDG